MQTLLLTMTALLSTAAVAEVIPATRAKTLAGQEFAIPNDLGGKRNVLILGFSQKSAGPCKAWGSKMGPKMSQQGVPTYSLHMLESVPRLVRGVVVRGIKSDTPQSRWPFSIPVFENESKWKQAVSFGAPDDAYVLVVDREGQIVWKTHGALSEEREKELEAALNGQNP